MRNIFVIFMATLILVANIYVFYRFWQIMPSHIIGKILLGVFAVFVLVSPFIGVLAGEYFPSGFTSLLQRTGNMWLFIFLYFLMIFFYLTY
jgi:hypothetical protein